MKNNVKKIIIAISVILVIAAASFFGGYSFGRNRFDDSRIAENTEFIREQDNTIEIIETGVEQSIEEVEIIKEEIYQSTESAKIIDSGLGEVEIGLQEDIEGISGVIDRLKYYRERAGLLEESNPN